MYDAPSWKQELNRRLRELRDRKARREISSGEERRADAAAESPNQK